ncbi:putative DNA-binding protein [Fructilactobacillus frigidiflavus]|uniref:putative DNA-binding protein n=1 Tax=Fructilactobacillus frigidiflavus TaxID=3242688 RepID=UPI0037580D92
MDKNFDVKLVRDNYINSLFDFYGCLLTTKQADYISQYYADDLSLGEISENFNVSRQAVYDNIKRTEKTLETYEAKMGLYEKFIKRNKVVDKLDSLIKEKHPNDLALNNLIDQLEKIEEE